ncbi:UNVERIFIED_CONTAM: hypothetical protein NCL1_11935 [Trichonephila clavipes]
MVRTEPEEENGEAGTPLDLCHTVRMPKSNAQRGKEFCERRRKKKEKQAASPVEKCYCQISIRVHLREYRAWKKIAKYSLNAEFKGWECYRDSFYDSTD